MTYGGIEGVQKLPCMGGGSRYQGLMFEGRGYSKVQCMMDNGHMGTEPLLDSPL